MTIHPNGLIDNFMVVDDDGRILATGLTREGAEMFIANRKLQVPHSEPPETGG